MENTKANIIELPKIYDSRGNLSVIENFKQLPFAIKRTRWIYGMPSGSSQNGYALRTQNQLIVALSGCCDVAICDGKCEQMFHLQRASQALLIPAMTWRSIGNFSTNTVLLILSSGEDCPEEYIYDKNSLISPEHNE